MPTASVNLSTTEYKRVNVGRDPMLLQAHRDSVRVVFSDSKPTLSNATFHLLNGGSDPLHIPEHDTHVWALAMTDTSSLVVTEWTNEDVWVSVEADDVNYTAINIDTNPNLYYNLFSLKNVSADTRCEVAVANFVVDANKSVEFVAQIDSVLSGNTAFTAHPDTAVLEVSYEGTSDGPVSGARTVLLKTSDRRSDVRGTKIYIPAGSTLTLAARGLGGSSVTGDIVASFRVIVEA